MSERTAKGPTSSHQLTHAQQVAGRRAAEARATIPDATYTVTAALPGGAQRQPAQDQPPAGPHEHAGPLLAAVAAALRRFPALGGVHRDGALIAHERVNIAVVVAGDDWALAPTLVDADTRSAAELAGDLDRLRAAAMAGELTAAALAGATFTVAGLSLDGIRRVTPVITPGQAAALGVGAPEDRPLVADGVVTIARCVDLTLVVDARVIQGTLGPRFLRAVADGLTTPAASQRPDQPPAARRV